MKIAQLVITKTDTDMDALMHDASTPNPLFRGTDKALRAASVHHRQLLTDLGLEGEEDRLTWRYALDGSKHTAHDERTGVTYEVHVSDVQ